MNAIHNADCLEGMAKLRDESIDLIVTSPPYNLGDHTVHSHIKYDTYSDDMPHDQYLLWLKSIFTEAHRVLRDSGRCVINIADSKNGSIPVHVDVVNIMREIGFNVYTTFVWDKIQIGRRTAWGSFKSPSCPSFPTQFEFVLVFYKGDSRKLKWKGETDLTKEEFIDWSMAYWRFTPETRQKKIGHPAMFPKELPKRVIKMFSWKDATVLDPFAGAGTTLVVAKELGRNYLGFEISEDYCRIANERLTEIV